jgi:hypothetical protein
MKRMLTIIATAVVCAVGIVLAEEFNPHAGLTSRIKTNWDHKDGNRLMPPKAIQDAVELMNRGAAWKGNNTRPTMGHVFASPNNVEKAAAEPENPAHWDIVEDWRYERFQLQGGRIIHSMQINTAQVPQCRLFIPAKRDAAGNVKIPEQYPLLYEVDDTNNSLRIGRMTSGVSSVNFANAITVEANGVLSLPFAQWRPPVASPYPGHGYLDVGSAPAGWCVEKNGVKYLKVRHNYKSYGIKLEPMDW